MSELLPLSANLGWKGADVLAMLAVITFLAMTLLFSLGWQQHVYLYQLAVDPRSSVMPPFMLAINP